MSGNKKYMVFGSLEVKLPEKMVKETKKGNVGFKQTVSKNGNFTKTANIPSVKISTGNEADVKIVKQPRYTTVKDEKKKIAEIKSLERRAAVRYEASNIINRAIKGKLARKQMADLKK